MKIQGTRIAIWMASGLLISLGWMGCESDKEVSAAFIIPTEEGGESAEAEGGESIGTEDGKSSEEEGGESTEAEEGESSEEEGGESSEEEGGESSEEAGGESTESEGGESTESEGGEFSEEEGGESTESEGGESTDPEGGESTESEGGESTEPEGGETSEEEGGESTDPEGGETSEEEGGESTGPEGGETSEEEGGESTGSEGGETSEEEGGESTDETFALIGKYSNSLYEADLEITQTTWFEASWDQESEFGYSITHEIVSFDNESNWVVLNSGWSPGTFDVVLYTWDAEKAGIYTCTASFGNESVEEALAADLSSTNPEEPEAGDSCAGAFPFSYWELVL